MKAVFDVGVLLKYGRLSKYLKASDWAGYGKELDALKVVLDQLAELAAVE